MIPRFRLAEATVLFLLAVLSLLALAVPAAAQDPNSSPEPNRFPGLESSPIASMAWPSGDELRRELQDIGFTFRIERESGDWLGWAPRASIVEAPAVTLGGAGAAEATATFRLDLLQTDLLGADVDAALTALMEIAARLPLDPVDMERARQFVVSDLLTEPPETLEACYLAERASGVILIGVDTETGLATLDLAARLDAIDIAAQIEPGSCAAISPSASGVAPGGPTSERITIGMTSGEVVAFDPAETTVEGELVTLVLTFRNDSAVEQSLTFEAPLDSDTGPVAPGERKLIVVRQLEPGDYPFFSRSDPNAIAGRVRVVEPGRD